MKLKGEKLKDIRRKRGLSQTALAEGICTQATISLMEKQNRIPKMNILNAICSRLNVEVGTLIQDDDVSMTALFDEISLMLVRHDFKNARKELGQIKVKKLETEFDKQRYYYLLGMEQVQNDQVDEAIFNFELILTQFTTMSANIYWALTTVGMARAYEKRGNSDRALKFVQRAVNLIDKKKMAGGRRQLQILYRDIASLYLELGKPEQAVEMAKRGIDLCRQNESLFLLASYYSLVGQADLKEGKDQEGHDNLVIARSVAIANEEQMVVDEVNQLLK